MNAGCRKPADWPEKQTANASTPAMDPTISAITGRSRRASTPAPAAATTRAGHGTSLSTVFKTAGARSAIVPTENGARYPVQRAPRITSNSSPRLLAGDSPHAPCRVRTRTNRYWEKPSVNSPKGDGARPKRETRCGCDRKCGNGRPDHHDAGVVAQPDREDGDRGEEPDVALRSIPAQKRQHHRHHDQAVE